MRSPDYSGTVPGAARATARNVVLPFVIVLVLAVALVVSAPRASAAVAINPSPPTNPSQLLWRVFYQAPNATTASLLGVPTAWY